MRPWSRALIATLLSGCGPSAEELRTALADGDLSRTAAIAAAEPDGPLGALVPLARRWTALQPALQGLQAAEVPLLLESVEEAMDQEDWGQAAVRLGVAARAGELSRDRLLHLSRQIETAARAADPTTTHTVLAALAEVWADDPAQRHRLAQEAVRAAVVARYSPAQLEAVRAGQEGITVDAAEALLRRLDTAYVVPVDWSAALQQGTARLGALAAAPPARATWPKLADVVFTGGTAPDVDAAIAGLQQSVALGTATGVPAEVLVDEWVAGALGSLDPWTRAVWPAELASWSAGHSGVYAGIGVALTLDAGGQVQVERPLPNTPAWQADILQDDVIEAISDPSGRLVLAEMSVEQRLALAQAALRGPVDTVVRLELHRPQVGPVTVELRRASVVAETVEGWRRTQTANQWQVLLPDPAPTAASPGRRGIAHVRIPRFKPTTEAAFDALLDPHLDDIYGLILDLRGNPGGDVNSAVQIADRFVADGWLATLEGRVLPDTGPDVDPATGEALAEWNRALPGHALEGVAVAVLVDEETASAAEVLAGALQERADAVVLGAATWGKGRAQALRTADDGSHGVQFTNVVWALPSGRRLDRSLDGGITPDVLLQLGPATTYQVSQQRLPRTALKVHRDGRPLRQPTPSLNPALPQLAEDPAVLAAELVLRARLMAPAP